MARRDCIIPRPTLETADWRAVCGNSRKPDLAHCCAQKECGASCKVPTRTSLNESLCARVPNAFVERSFALGAQGGALAQLRRRLACSQTPSLNIAVAGGSVTAGPAGRSWANYMIDALKARKSRFEFSLSKLASNGVGPAYLSACWEHHFAKVPDVAILEYAVNDFGPSVLDMEALVRNLLMRGIVVVVLHHFSPAFITNGIGYKGLVNATAEAKHARLVQHYALSSISVGEAVGLSQRSSAWRRAATAATLDRADVRGARGVRRRQSLETNAAMLHACSFLCLFNSDQIHPTPCGQRMMGRLATHAVRSLLADALSTPCSSPPAASWWSTAATRAHEAKTGACTPLPAPLSWTEAAASPTLSSCVGSSKCWSNVGAPATWNLLPKRNRGFTQINLKSNGKDVPGAGRVFKMLWEGRKPGSYIDFPLTCSSREYQAVRVMYLTGHSIHYGHGRIEIDGQTAGVESAFRAKQGSLFKPADYAFPTRCGGGECPVEQHVVRVTVLNTTAEPGGRKVGFGINSISTLRRPKPTHSAARLPLLIGALATVCAWQCASARRRVGPGSEGLGSPRSKSVHLVSSLTVTHLSYSDPVHTRVDLTHHASYCTYCNYSTSEKKEGRPVRPLRGRRLYDKQLPKSPRQRIHSN